jgi:uncharacterized protein (TIGR02145 family)
VVIGTQKWMVENLNVDHFQNGDVIFHAKTDEQWYEASCKRIPAWCYLLNEVENGRKYGRLYNWFAVNDSRDLAPKGFKIATDEDWKAMERFLGMPEEEVNEKVKDAYRGIDNKIGGKLKSSVYINGGSMLLESSNESGFSGLPGGMRTSSGRFQLENSYGKWWCKGEGDEGQVWRRSLLFSEFENNESVFRGFTLRGNGHSVRCIVDSSQEHEQLKNSDLGILTITDDAFIQQSETGHIQILAEIKNSQLDGSFEDFYSNGNKKSKGVIKDGMKQSLWSAWYENGQLLAETNFQNDLEYGFRKEWHQNGNIRFSKEYSAGIECGLTKSWYENGQMMFVQNYKQGLKDGLREEWYENGHPKFRIDFVEDKVTGLYELWHENGNKRLKFSAIDSINNGQSEQWNQAAQTRSKSFYVDGKREALHEEWFNNGQIKIRGNYKQGLPDGPHSDWHENGQIKVKTTLKDGLMNGLYEEWFENGRIKARAEMRLGSKCGNWEIWDIDGNLIEKCRLD